MGMYLNPGSVSFRMAYNSEIFVDKTGMPEVRVRILKVIAVK